MLPKAAKVLTNEASCDTTISVLGTPKEDSMHCLRSSTVALSDTSTRSRPSLWGDGVGERKKIYGMSRIGMGGRRIPSANAQSRGDEKR